MPSPGEHKTVQARILAYAQEVGWTLVSREDAEGRRGKNGGQPPSPNGYGGPGVCPPSLFFDDLLDAKVREFNPRYAEAEGALLGKFRHLHADIYGNREFVEHLRNRGKFYDPEEKRERDLILIELAQLIGFRPEYDFLAGAIHGNVPNQCVKEVLFRQSCHIRN